MNLLYHIESHPWKCLFIEILEKYCDAIMKLNNLFCKLWPWFLREVTDEVDVQKKMPKLKDILHKIQYKLFHSKTEFHWKLHSFFSSQEKQDLKLEGYMLLRQNDNLPTEPKRWSLPFLPASLASSRQWWRCSNSVTPSKNNAYWATARSWGKWQV